MDTNQDPQRVVIEIGSSSSRCSACGNDADPFEKSHTKPMGYRQIPGCGATYTHAMLTTFRGDGIDHAARMRPDLISLTPMPWGASDED